MPWSYLLGPCLYKKGLRRYWVLGFTRRNARISSQNRCAIRTSLRKAVFANYEVFLLLCKWKVKAAGHTSSSTKFGAIKHVKSAVCFKYTPRSLTRKGFSLRWNHAKVTHLEELYQESARTAIPVRFANHVPRPRSTTERWKVQSEDRLVQLQSPRRQRAFVSNTCGRPVLPNSLQLNM